MQWLFLDITTSPVIRVLAQHYFSFVFPPLKYICSLLNRVVWVIGRVKCANSSIMISQGLIFLFNKNLPFVYYFSKYDTCRSCTARLNWNKTRLLNIQGVSEGIITLDSSTITNTKLVVADFHGSAQLQNRSEVKAAHPPDLILDILH